jgi:hypothetical protein
LRDLLFATKITLARKSVKKMIDVTAMKHRTLPDELPSDHNFGCVGVREERH